jgi:AcrR family transcriptional regulator
VAASTRKASEKRPRSRRSPLSVEKIVSAALALSDTRGDFSMRALGQKLRVDPMAIYRHFRDKDALLDGMVDAALADLSAPPPEAGGPADRLRRMSIDFRDALAAHPGVALRVSTTRPTLGPHTVALTDACMGMMLEIGLDAHEATRAFFMLIRFITGVAVADERLHAEGSDETTWREELRAGYASVAPEQHPNVAALAGQVAGLRLQEEFEYGLDLILEGLVRRGEGASSGAPGVGP